jgi:hypothetical protein
MTADEKLVRETWRKVVINQYGLSLWDERDRRVKAFLGIDSDMPALWKAAADFTQKRLKEIAEQEEEIALMEMVVSQLYFGAPASVSVYQRIINRLKSIRDDLRRGMKESA